jgi:valyl-tRNA synthetase
MEGQIEQPPPAETEQKPQQPQQPAKAQKKQPAPKKQPAAKKPAPAAGEKKAKKDEIRLKKEFNNTTPKGDKKDMTQPMLNEYDPPAVEAAWYDWWAAQGFFRADENDQTKEKFIIVIPPPNVTGSLHMGHALTNSIQDALCRWHRMSGKNVLWVPGTDHAGIATQVVVEKKLKKERDLSRHDLGREKFIEEVWRWKGEYGAQICNQLRRLGSSLDWSREVFTMDEKLSVAVVEAFVRMYENGLIYRGTRLVNWCTELKTAISDVEVEHKNLTGRHKMKVPGYGKQEVEFGVLTSFAYPIENSEEQIVVSTTRIETMLGDTAVAVHPDDERYKHLHGKFAVHPFNGRRIPIITDAILVDKEVGTGAVKITPAHDPKDYDCGKRHGLQMINIFTDDGLINEEGGAPFTGMKRFDARVAVAKALEDKGLLRDSQDNPMIIPICSRTKDVIEPRLKPQWWVRCKGMADDAVKAVKEKRLEIVPAMHEAVWYRWLENIQDWCISRQLWWGHRIPAFIVHIDGQPAPDPEDQNNWVVGRSREEALEKAKAKHTDVAPEKIRLEQDPDVLDTWFSSGLFPFSVMGWPNETADLKAFYPTSLLETGHDILFFWVARMVMMGLNLTGQLPFSQVLLHAMVRDAHGRKMSKSLGNVVDPIDVTEGIRLEDMHTKLREGNLDPAEVEKAVKGQQKDFPNGISECGTDAMRFALCAYTSQGRDINLDINRVVSYRHFCNKLWNATKFALMNLGADYAPLASSDVTGQESVMEKWILSRLHSAVKDADEGWKSFELAQCTTAIYNFWLYELCDVYLEAIKPAMRNKGSPEQKSAQHTLYTCLDFGLKLLHPFMPFVTEELYQRIPRRPDDSVCSIMVSSYPKPAHTQPWANERLEADVKLAQDIIRASRALRADNGLPPSSKPTFFLEFHSDELRNTFRSFAPIILTLSGASEVNILEGDAKPPSGCAVNILNENVEIHIFLKGLIDPDVEVKKLEKKLGESTTQLENLEKKMKVPLYEDKVPAAVKQSNTERVGKLNQEIEAIKQAIEKFKAMKAN